MKIEKLKELGFYKIYESAVLNYMSYNRSNRSIAELGDTTSFLWFDTFEGSNFWAAISRGDFNSAERIKPKMFKVEDSNIVTEEYSVKINGLFR